MKQLVQTLKDGRIRVLDVPPPLLCEGMILVRNYYSLISTGTERGTISVARKSLLSKAKERPQQVQQVIESIKRQGLVLTYRAVNKKLDAYSPLGYSCAGKAIAVAPDVTEFVVGDLTACGGISANHAEIVAVQKNLCVKLPPDVDLKKAAYNTLGSIALQGVRQADLKIGETCVVIGLGLIGQLTCLILRAGGVKVVGIDIDPVVVDIAQKKCVDFAYKRDETVLSKKIDNLTGSIGADVVIITAATKSLDPVNFAGQIARKKGKVIVVGDVPTGFERELYYEKELELKMSCSYGPGRYDYLYEEKGIDYPVGYVRWTEKRNMQAFQELVHSGKIGIDYLTTHIFELENAVKAYDLILKKPEPFLGILFKYDIEQQIKADRKIKIGERKPEKKVNIAFIGTGSYAQGSLLPNIPKDSDVTFKGVMDLSGAVSRKVAEKYSFEFCTSDEKDIFNNDAVNTVFIASRHNSHAEYVLKSLKAGKHMHVEKPLCLIESELEEIKKTYDSLSSHTSSPLLILGFNRRFSKLTEILKERIGEGPMAMIYRINSGHIPQDTWIQDKDIGGGRIIGEVCHFVDFLSFINGSLPESVFAACLPDPENNEDIVNVNLKFRNGSIGSISYFSNGSRSLFKEYIEVYKSGVTGIIKDFKELEIYGGKKTFKKKLITPDKGQKRMIRTFIDSIKEGKFSPIEFEDIYYVTLTTFRIIESFRENRKVEISKV